MVIINYLQSSTDPTLYTSNIYFKIIKTMKQHTSSVVTSKVSCHEIYSVCFECCMLREYRIPSSRNFSMIAGSRSLFKSRLKTTGDSPPSSAMLKQQSTSYAVKRRKLIIHSFHKSWTWDLSLPLKELKKGKKSETKYSEKWIWKYKKYKRKKKKRKCIESRHYSL